MTGIHTFLAALPIVFFACAPPHHARGESIKSHFITEAEIDASHGATAYEVIQELRPNFLTYRGETNFDRKKSQPYPTVYLDGQEFGPISILRTIPAPQIATIRLYRSWEATTQFGTGKMGGVIAITTRQ
jgi:hypothetical protein